MINFVDAGRNKNCRYIWEDFSRPWEKIGFLNSYDLFE
jgi:hypothetical protein